MVTTMNEVTPKETAAPILREGYYGKETAGNVSTSEQKIVSTWKRIGRIEIEKQALKITISTPYSGQQIYHIGARDLQQLTSASRMPCDIVRIRKGIDGAEVTEKAGRAYRSRSGKALCLKINTLAASEAMVPWSALMKVIKGQQQAAPVSMLEKSDRTENRQQHGSNPLSRGLVRGF